MPYERLNVSVLLALVTARRGERVSILLGWGGGGLS